MKTHLKLHANKINHLKKMGTLKATVHIPLRPLVEYTLEDSFVSFRLIYSIILLRYEPYVHKNIFLPMLPREISNVFLVLVQLSTKYFA